MKHRIGDKYFRVRTFRDKPPVFEDLTVMHIQKGIFEDKIYDADNRQIIPADKNIYRNRMLAIGIYFEKLEAFEKKQGANG